MNDLAKSIINIMQNRSEIILLLNLQNYLFLLLLLDLGAFLRVYLKNVYESPERNMHWQACLRTLYVHACTRNMYKYASVRKIYMYACVTMCTRLRTPCIYSQRCELVWNRLALKIYNTNTQQVTCLYVIALSMIKSWVRLVMFSSQLYQWT